MSMRRSRLSVRPNIGAPKSRAAPTKPTTSTVEDASANPPDTDETVKKEEKTALDGTTTDDSTIVESSKPKTTRRSAAKPKPNIPGRGTNRSKATEVVPDEPAVSTSNDFTTIKPVQAEVSVEKSVEEVDKPVAIAPEKSDTVQESKTPVSADKVEVPESIDKDKAAAADDSKKIRFRSRFAKARPNIEAIARPRIRHPSLSHSDSDGFPMKEPPPVHRVVTLTNNESATNAQVFRKPADVTPGKEGFDIRRTPLKTPTRDEYRLLQQDEQTKKRKKLLVLDEPVDRGKLKMKDLIHMNPKSNPMKAPTEEEERRESIGELSPSAKPRTRKESTSSTTSNNRVKIGPDGQIVLDDDETDNSKEIEKESEDKNKEDEDEDDSVPAPQVTIGADGQIVLNESSLVLHNPIHDTSQEEMEVVHENNNWAKGASQYGYRKKRVKQWTENETKKFYLALTAVGTDFSLMVKLFPGRTRAELKRKWQREEKTSRHLLDKAIKDRYQFEKDFFEELKELDKLDEQLKESKQMKAAEKKSEEKAAKKRKEKESSVKVQQEGQPKRKKRKKGKSKLYIDSSSESEQDDVSIIEKDTVSEKDDETIDESQVIANMQNKPSRSGRTIKTFILGQPGATSTSDAASVSSPLSSPKPSTEIRIRRISGTPSSPGPPRGRVRTQSTSSQSKPRVRTLSGSSTASTGKAPGQFLALSNIQQAHSESPAGTTDMQPGSLVFVQSNPTVNDKGEVTPGLVHIYMVSSPPSANTSSSPKAGPSTSAPCTPGGFKSNQFSLLRTPSTESAHSEGKAHHSPTILRKSPKRTLSSPQRTSDVQMTAAQNVSATLSETQTVLAGTEHTPVAGTSNNENTEIPTVEIVDVDVASDTLCIGTSPSIVQEQEVETETVVRDDATDGETIIYVQTAEVADNNG